MAEGIIKRGKRIASIVLNTRKLSRLDDERERDLAKRALANQFADARGTIMKIGQLLAHDENRFQELLKGIPAIPLDDIKPFLEQTLGQPLSQVFKSIDEAGHAASLGQVHHAILQSGEEVAVKIQYPDIAGRIHAEIKLLGLMPGLGPVKKWGFDLGAYKNAFKTNMDRELDYQQEAATQQQFRQQLVIPGLVIPRVFTEYTRPNLLIQSWESGQYLDEIAHWPATDRNAVATILVSTLFKSLFEAGLVHGDPHLGNSYYRYNPQHQPEVVLMDFGCTIAVSRTERLALLKLILATMENTQTSPLRCFAAMGFDADKLRHIGDRLPMLCKILFQPFTEFGNFPLTIWQLENRVNKLLEEKRWWFRSAGPAKLFLLMRAFQGLVQQLEQLKTSVSWSRLLLTQIDKTVLDEARSLTLPPLPQEDTLQTPDIKSLASHLRVRVSEKGRNKADITLPAEMVLELSDLMPADVLQKLESTTDVDLEKIQDSIRESGLAPQTVFELSLDDKNYRVWLE